VAKHHRRHVALAASRKRRRKGSRVAAGCACYRLNVRAIALIVVLGWSACGFHPTGSDPADDAGDSDGSVVDAATVDAGLAIDGAPIDGTTIDTAVIDAAVIDAAVIDAALIDAVLIDARLIDARVPCPLSYNIAVSGSLYRYDDVAVSYIAATANCSGDLVGRTHLATFEGSNLNTVIDSTNAGDGEQIYVGARCTMTGPACDNKNNWRWIGSGSAVASGLWDSGEPSQGLSNSYTSHGSGTWRLTSITGGDRPYLCECEP
jgi:hypothetical protein